MTVHCVSASMRSPWSVGYRFKRHREKTKNHVLRPWLQEINKTKTGKTTAGRKTAVHFLYFFPSGLLVMYYSFTASLVSSTSIRETLLQSVVGCKVSLINQLDILDFQTVTQRLKLMLRLIFTQHSHDFTLRKIGWQSNGHSLKLAK